MYFQEGAQQMRMWRRWGDDEAVKITSFEAIFNRPSSFVN